MRHALLLLTLLIAPLALRGQAVRFDSNSYTTNSSCVGGSLCNVLAIPGATINFCSGTQATLALCLSNPATTYTSFTAGTPCPTTAQLTAATGATACTSKSNNQGDFGAWFLPGQYSFYIRPPSSAGGGTYGPYPINVGASSGCPLGVTCDASYQTLAAACTAAGAGTLYVTRTWSGLTTQSLACNIQALANGIIKPASGQTVTLTASFDGSYTQHFDTSLGDVVLSGASTDLAAQWFGMVGDGSTDNTTAFSRAAKVAMASFRGLYFPPGHYVQCGASVTGSGPVIIHGDGMFATSFNPFGGPVACNVMFTATTTGPVEYKNFGIVQGFVGHTLNAGSGFTVTGPGSAGALTPPSSCTFENLYIATAKSVGLQASPCQVVHYDNNISFQNYFVAASFSSSGTGIAPLYSGEFEAHGNISIDESIGIEFNFYLIKISAHGNIFSQSGMFLTQAPNAYADLGENVYYGVPDVGCYVDSQCGTIAGSWSPLAFEGAGHVVVGKEYLSNINGTAGAFEALGSDVTLGGSNIPLPINDIDVDGLVVENSTAGFPLLVNTASTTFGGSPIRWGGGISIRNTKLIGVNQCQLISAASSFIETNNSCENSSNGGYALSNDQNGVFQNNVCHNCNTSGGTTYITGTVSGSAASASITGSGTTFISGMIGGSFTAAGTVYQICARSSNTAITLCTPLVTALSGSSYSIYYGGGNSDPGLLISGTGTYNIAVKANSFQNDSGNSTSIAISDTTGLTPAQSLITYDANNTCTGPCGAGIGIYSPVPTYTPTLASCGTGSPVVTSGSTNASGQFAVGGGTVTACTLTFAGSGFSTNGSTTTQCLFNDDAHAVTFTVSAQSSSLYTISSGATNIAGDTIRYNCNAPTAQADQGKYPYPYFWR